MNAARPRKIQNERAGDVRVVRLRGGRIAVMRRTEGRHGQNLRGANERQARTPFFKHDCPSTSLIRC